MAFYGINCRATSTFVTDGANDDYSLGGTGTRTGPGGHQHSWSSDKTGQARDRSVGVTDVRQAGIIFNANGGAVATLSVSLPSGPGIYNVRLSVGDFSNAQSNQKVVVKDGGTTLITVTGDTSAAGRFLDATSAELTDFAWPGSNTAVQVTFSGSTASVEVGNTTGSGNTCLSHVAFEFVSAAGGTVALSGSAATSNSGTQVPSTSIPL